MLQSLGPGLLLGLRGCLRQPNISLQEKNTRFCVRKAETQCYIKPCDLSYPIATAFVRLNVKMVKPLNRLFRESVVSPSMEMFKNSLDKHFPGMVWTRIILP